MTRLDKYLCDCHIGTRSEVKQYIKKNYVTVNEMTATDPSMKLNDSDTVCFKGEALSFRKYCYIMLNKPSGVVTARTDKNDKTVMELISTNFKDMSPVGRLDKDTEGILLITNDGRLNHNMLSPKKHVDKTYLVTLKHPIDTSDIKALEAGVNIGDDDITLPAKCRLLEEYLLELTIHEGRYHQVKRMLEAVNNKVVHLKRISFGPLQLDSSLAAGEYRELTQDEYESIYMYTE